MVGKEVLMGSDAPPGHYERPQGFSVTEPAEAERIFAALSEKRKVHMPLQQLLNFKLA